MKRKEIEEKFIDLIDGTLSPEEITIIENEIEKDPELKRSFDEYKSIISLENTASARSYHTHESFVVKVMNKVHESANSQSQLLSLWRSTMEVFKSRKLLATVATCAVLLIALQVEQERPEKRVAYIMKKLVDLSEPGKQDASNESTPTDNSSKVAAIFDKLMEKMEQPSGGHQERALRSLPIEKTNSRLKTAKLRDQAAYDNVLATLAPEIQNQQAELADSHRTRAFSQYAAAIPELEPGPEDPYWIPDGSEVDTMIMLNKSTEKYGFFAENPRTLTAQNPLSTFSLDVDTGSYTNMRRFLKQGQLPPPDSVRIEEYLNYFDYDYPVVHDKAFGLNYEIAPSPLDPGRFLLKLALKAKDAKDSGKPWNIVFLIDVSGSMDEANKLPLVKQALSLLARQMQPSDHVSIVTYAGNSGVALEPTAGSSKEKILTVIESLGAGGSTAGSAGIKTAYELAQRSFVKGGVNRVILATDGDFNVGTTDQAELIRIIEEKRRSGVTLTTIGVGEGNLNEAMMEQLADKGNGNYFYLDNFSEARKVFEKDLFKTIEIVAKDVKAQIEFNPSVVKEYRLVGYDNRKLNKEDFNNDAIDAGEVGSDQAVTVLYELVLNGSDFANTSVDELRYQQKEQIEKPKTLDETLKGEVAFLKLRYKEPDASDSKLLDFPIEASKVARDSKAVSDDFRFAAAVSYFGTLLRQSSFKGNYAFDDIATLAESALDSDKSGARREFAELARNAAALKH